MLSPNIIQFTPTRSNVITGMSVTQRLWGWTLLEITDIPSWKRARRQQEDEVPPLNSPRFVSPGYPPYRNEPI